MPWGEWLEFLRASTSLGGSYDPILDLRYGIRVLTTGV